jgi:Uma2 family endonuclease
MTLAGSLTERRVVMNDVSWDFYQRMLAEIGDGRLRLVYDGGRLEIRSPSPIHEHVKKVLARIIEAYADACGVPVEGLGSTTFDREDLAKGIEPDECYYVAHAADVVGKETLDLAVDPPPDLAVEIDISPPDVARQPIYAALGVPEVWRYDGQRVQFLRRAGASGYISADRSLSFPDLPLEQVNALIQIGLRQGQSAAVQALTTWLKARP